MILFYRILEAIEYVNIIVGLRLVYLIINHFILLFNRSLSSFILLGVLEVMEKVVYDYGFFALFLVLEVSGFSRIF